jgi:Tfp pilus assembly protein PilX
MEMKSPCWGVDAMKGRRVSNNESGTILIIVLVMLLLLTLLGISATTTSTIEMQIAGNERVYKKNFYAAEAASMTCAQELENETDAETLKALTPDWLHSTLPDIHISGDTNWDSNNSELDEVAHGRYLAVYAGIAPGSSMDIGSNKSSLHEYNIWGRSTQNNGETIIQVGYRKRF